ncbi:multidrug resistance-associated ABC transporter [Phanerochaete sordida]|uniref:Multidrug resistance-associated ABC transporter n=1 Tax=Phanerochaete sordida TaxID=48140 RepID=A0A9P3LAS1_9APHY|nr:multidrug resistance-associated ABC transporter [Phanerochaete sordida]
MSLSSSSEVLLFVPICAAGISACIFAAQIVAQYAQGEPGRAPSTSHTSSDDARGRSSLVKRVAGLGGLTSTVLSVLRALSCVVLLAISIYASTTSSAPSLGQFALCATYAYTAVVSFLSLASSPWNTKASPHLTVVLLATWLTYLYRDMWPLATYYLEPADEQNLLFWTAFVALSVCAVIVPLTLPREYVPYDPEDPTPNPNPEQTCSILSRVFFNFLNPVVWDGYRSPRQVVERLPPLCDYERMKHMSKRSAPYLDPLDPRSSRHVFWGLLRLYKWEYFELWFHLILLSLAGFLTPIGVNRILHYLETGGEGATIRPWFWILTFFTSFAATALVSGRYMFIALRILVEAQNTLTQLIFEHALRVRLSTDIGTPSGAEASESASVIVEAAESDTDTTPGEGQSASKGGANAARTAHIHSSVAGRINNLVSSDVSNLENGHGWIMAVWFTPLQIVLSMIFLCVLLGWSALVGVGTMVVMLNLPGIIATYSHRLQEKRMAKSDARVGLITEVMGSAIRMVKLFGWERKIGERIDERRREELHALRNFRLLSLVNSVSNVLITLVTMIATFASYTLVAKGELTASKVFSAIEVFLTLQDHLRGWTASVPSCIQAKVSLDRITDFLRKTELLDSFVELDLVQQQGSASALSDPSIIGIRDASFTWNTAAPAGPFVSQQTFKLCIGGELVFQRGRINLVVGPTGSGKTSLLMALLGEMHYVPLGTNSYVSLPRDKGVAYHAQESWILNETIRNNILFGAPFEQERYNAVLRQCALERDLSLFEAGDRTEVGERGVTLSGGQKARITLARAVYSNAEILLLDDVLAALDVHTAHSIVEECFQGDLVRGRTVILVTHNVALAAPIADFVVSMGADGRIKSQGTMRNVLERDSELSAEVTGEKSQGKEADDAEGEAQNESGKQQLSGKLIVAEEVAEGHVAWSSLKLLLANTAKGPGLAAFWVTFLVAFLGSRCLSILNTWVLGLWAREYEMHDPAQVSVSYYLALYAAVSASSVLFLIVARMVYMYGTLRASRIIHQALIDTVLNATFRWLDKTPYSRIITRCTQDIATVDNQIPDGFFFLIEITATMLLKFCAVILVSPTFAGPGVLVFVLGGLLFQIYMKAQLPVKRAMSNDKAPVMGHISAAIDGLVSIRAYGAQDAFRQESYRRLDRLTATSRIYRNLSKWISIRAELLAAGFMACLTAYLVYVSGQDASSIGFSLSMADGFSHLILWFFLTMNDFQVEANSLERIHQYLVIEQEPESTDSGVPPAYWPASGSLRVEKLSAAYSKGGPQVLHDITFELKPGERVGIVGRTGSGKSSLALSLLRSIPTNGTVYFDGRPTDSVNLDALRSNITIIPQVPELLAGTLRENLDPFFQHDDATLNEGLRAAGLFSLQSNTDAARLTLDSHVSSSGSNLSVGQRQIIALARAMVRRSKLIILDEATSAIDYNTDAIIQESLRKEVPKDVTVLTIAHRLQTIMDSDQIMVLDAGRIVEFGPPTELLRDSRGLFTSLINASGDKDKLGAMVTDNG